MKTSKLLAILLVAALAACGKKEEPKAQAPAEPAPAASAPSAAAPAPSAPAAAPTASAPESAAPAASTPPATAPAASTPAGSAPAASSGASAGGTSSGGGDLAMGEKIYNANCVSCHGAGVLGAPKFGDKAAWGPRIAQGKDTLYTHALNGFKMMPPRGGNAALKDDEVKAAVNFMASKAS